MAPSMMIHKPACLLLTRVARADTNTVPAPTLKLANHDSTDYALTCAVHIPTEGGP
ncbi:hypothetical protein SCLCIDRAFT_1210386 [Scleroderma citrinum Foug A]|uniref:Uncharacterized protein n=1 Tax=Scleroderma citrinum Foug A TaxID=1036808 RepID=A0A0C3AQW6_9AGAM|nr:hypothetical protein SCLCIDRAFT_1210386 [Scleroderma citrinum Foug A]